MSVITDICALTGCERSTAEFYYEANGTYNGAVNAILELDSTGTTQNTPTATATAPPSNVKSLKRKHSAGEEVRPAAPYRVDQLLIPLHSQPHSHTVGAVTREPFKRYAAAVGNGAGGTQWRNSRLHDLFTPSPLLTHYTTLADARRAADMSNRHIVVNIQKSTEFACHVLNRDVWRDANVVAAITAHFVFVQCAVDSVEGSTYVNVYHVKAIPHIAVIDAATSQLLQRFEPTPQQPNATPQIVMNMIRHFTQPQHNNDNHNRTETLTITDDDDDDIDDRDEDDEPADEDNEGSRVLVEHDFDDECDGASALESASAVPPVDIGVEPPIGADVCRVSFRFPAGSRVIRRFRRSDCVSSLYSFAAAHMAVDVSAILIVKPMPRTILTDMTQTLDDGNIISAALVIEIK